MYQCCPKVNAAQSEALHFLHMHGVKVLTVFVDDEGKEGDGPAKEENWEEDESNLGKVEIRLSFICSSPTLPTPASLHWECAPSPSGTGGKAFSLSKTLKN